VANVINKYDINLDMSQKIENFCLEKSIKIAGKIEFDEHFIVGSEFTRRTYSEKFPKAKIHVCNYGPSGYRLNSQPKSIYENSFD
jgi:MinD superfamily P-loop ATPase